MCNIINRIISNEFWGKLVKNVGVLFIGSSFASVLNFFTTILIIKAVSNESYGYFVVAQQYMTLIDAALNFQSWQGVIKYGSEALVSKNKNKLVAIIKCGYIIDVASAILGIVVAFLLIPLVAIILNLSNTIILLAYLFSIEIIFHLEGTSTGVLRLYDKFKYFSICNVITALIQLIAVFIMYIVGCRSLIQMTIVFIVFDIVSKLSILISAIVIIRKEGQLRNVVHADLHQIDKTFLKYTMWGNISRIADLPIGYFDVFIISTLSYELVSIFKIFKQIISMISKLTSPVSAAILPQFSMMVAKGNAKDAYHKVIRIRNSIGIVMISIIIICSFGAKPVFAIILGKEYAEQTLLFIVLLAVYGISFSYVAIHPFFASIGMTKEAFVINLISNAIYCVFLWTFVPIMGLYAVVIGTAVQFIGFIFVETIIIKKYLRYKCI